MAYDVDFTVNGPVRRVSGVTQVELGNAYLRCTTNVNGDEELGAMIPLDAVECVTDSSLSISSPTAAIAVVTETGD